MRGNKNIVYVIWDHPQQRTNEWTVRRSQPVTFLMIESAFMLAMISKGQETFFMKRDKGHPQLINPLIPDQLFSVLKFKYC